VELLALAKGPLPGLYYVATSPPECGQIRVRLMELPTNEEPPFKAVAIRAGGGVALINLTKISLVDYLFQHIGNVIEGEVKNGVLEGVVCNKKVKLRVEDRTLSGPVLAVVPVTKRRRVLPRVAVVVYAYEVKIA